MPEIERRITVNNNILIRLSASDDCIILSTYCRQHGRRGRFFMTRRMLTETLTSGLAYPNMIDADCGNYLAMNVVKNTCYFSVSWLSNSCGYLTGVRQEFELPLDLLMQVVYDEKSVRYLYIPHEPSSRIHLHCNAGKFARIVPNQRARRAFSKAMRDSFHYHDRPTIHLYADGSDGFYFRTEGDRSFCGGLIRHDSTKKVGNATYPRIIYSIHT